MFALLYGIVSGDGAACVFRDRAACEFHVEMDTPFYPSQKIVGPMLDPQCGVGTFKLAVS